jgi:Tol biopolymer transport system component
MRAPEIVPFTSFPGKQFNPAFSPDGNQIAFAWDRGEGESHIYIKLIGSEARLQLTTGASKECCPVWSPDGRNVAFVRWEGTDQGTFFVPALGGPERKLVQSTRPFDWSPNGKLLAFENGGSITLLDLEHNEERKLTSSLGDYHPLFSPDGRSVAFIRRRASVNDIYTVPTSGGKSKRVTYDNREVDGLAWTQDGAEIVYSSLRAGTDTLWRISASGGNPRRIAPSGLNAGEVAISRRAHRLAYTALKYDSNIWRFPVRGDRVSRRVSKQLIASTQKDDSPQYSPDGKRITFASNRSGDYQIWTCDSEGQNPIQLTAMQGPWTGSPRWSPDSKRIAFDSRPQGKPDIFIIDADGGVPRRLTDGSSRNIVPSWSRDGQSIYFASDRTGSLQIWKQREEGGQAVQITKNGGFESTESNDGKFLYYSKFDRPGMWRVPVQGGEEIQVPELAEAARWRYWSMNNSGIYFVPAKTSPHPVIKFFDFGSRRVRQIATLEKMPVDGLPGLSVSPDGQWILYAQVDQDVSNIMLVEDFR